jgi:DNA primase
VDYTPEQIEKVRDISIHEMLGLQNRGRNLNICCPFHDDRTPSFSLHPDNSYHCFGCDKNGHGFIDFCVHKGFTFKEIMEEYA